MKLICFDLNKTLIKENSWRNLNIGLGVTTQEDDQLMNWGERGIISDQEGQQILLKIYQSNGQHTRKNIEEILFNYTYFSGAKEIVEYSKELGYTPLLISGSIDILVEHVAKELDIEYWKANNIFEFNHDGYLSNIKTIDNDKHTKLLQLESLCQMLGVDIKDVICVGDGDSDSEIFEATGHGITFKGSKIEKEAWKIVNQLEDIKQIL